MKLYRYYTFNETNISAVAKNQLFLSSPLAFNDPYDSRFRASTSENEDFLSAAERYLKKVGVTSPLDRILVICARLRLPRHDLLFEGQIVEAPPFTDVFYELLTNIPDPFDFLGFLKNEFKKTSSVYCFANLVENLGLVSFSKNRHDPQMWSYYAGNHYSFCVEYDTSLFVQSPKLQLKEIEYSISLPTKLVDSQISEEKLVEQILVKSSHWTHEAEYRLISLDTRNSLIASPFKITGICSGLRMKQAEYKLLSAIEGVEFYYCSLDEDKYFVRWVPSEACFL